ncbi:hypothetical protein [Nonomuraea dietziae]|uniref:Uncharacterized protein n=1 Tax=Nonomuraea dietziae TaxID=65515 RepID=A0A7W5UTW4_9ACTN|nr:hypothetical protein [Nonomuraea dietziae]MBB3724482.1 hypothetical protein [Nonomuraea dietziae]
MSIITEILTGILLLLAALISAAALWVGPPRSHADRHRRNGSWTQFPDDRV